MTKDDILRMAREAGLYVGTNLSGAMLVGHAKHGSLLIHLDVDDLARFAARVAAAERKSCAQSCVEISKHYWMGDCQFEAATRCAAAIRERGAR